MTDAVEQVQGMLAAYRASGDGLVGMGEDIGQFFLGAPETGPLLAAMVGTDDEEGALDFLESVLGTARMARENRRPGGAAYISGLEAWIAERAAAGELTVRTRLGLARVFRRAGLPVPPEVALTTDAQGQILGDDGSTLAQRGVERVGVGDIDAGLRKLRREVGDDPGAIRQALGELFAVMPPEALGFFVTRVLQMPDPAFFEAGAGWLLDLDPAMRLAAAEAMEGLAEAGTLPASATLTLLRPWLPAGPERVVLDRAIRTGMRRGAVTEARRPAWKVETVLATLPDGAGAQSIAILARQGRRWASAVVLLKIGHGVHDAFVVRCRSRAEAESLLDQLEEECVSVVAVTETHVTEMLAEALGEGLASGLPPAAGLIDIVAILGLSTLTPQLRSPSEIVAAIDRGTNLTRLTRPERKRLDAIAEEYEPDADWFDASEAISDAIETAKTDRAAWNVIWAALDARRDFWARLLARAAVHLAAADDQDWIAPAYSAHALATGEDIRKLPVMAAVAEMTMYPPGPAPGASVSEPEADGELALLLAGSDVGAGWVDGFVTAAAVAPVPQDSPEFLLGILDHLRVADPTRAGRILEIASLRFFAASAPRPAAEIRDRFAGRGAETAADWHAGFAAFVDDRPDVWPLRRLPKAEREVLKLIDAVADGDVSGLAALEAELPRWLARRYEAIR